MHRATVVVEKYAAKEIRDGFFGDGEKRSSSCALVPKSRMNMDKNQQRGRVPAVWMGICKTSKPPR